MSKHSSHHLLGLAVLLTMTACQSPATRETPSVPGAGAPYPQSRAIEGVSWDFTTVMSRAKGSDLWPCAWARDDNLYCAWGDGGGFDGNDDHIGRVSSGIASIEGGSHGGTLSIVGKNVWGEPPYAQHAATFGGKIDSLISVDGILYANGGFWTEQNDPDPVHKSGLGPVNSLAWSADLGVSWQIAPWSSLVPLGSFLDLGRDNAQALDSYIYLYYVRESDSRHVFLKRVAKDRLLSDPSVPGTYQYLTGVDARGRVRGWSPREADAGPIFFDANNVEGPEVAYDAKLGRFLLTVGHYPSGRMQDASVARLGIFESRHPWGPWATVGYYDNWGAFGSSDQGDYLGVHVPAKWISTDGKILWCVFSGLHELDSFNVVKGTLKMRWWHRI